MDAFPTLFLGFIRYSNDQAYYQRAVASKGTTTVKAFLMGGLAWFSIPFVSSFLPPLSNIIS